MNAPNQSALPLRLARRWWTWLVIGLVLLAALIAGRAADLDGAKRTSIPVPSPIFTIEATSNGHTASILNLGIQPIGVPQVPVPVDVDGDLLPDVTVSVNLVDIQGISNPPDIAEIIAPNVEINRFPLELGTTILGRPSPPLKINVRFDVLDLEGEDETMHLRFGYDTGPGGSIPAFFQATLKGIEDLFSPLEAEISTKGALLAQSTDPIWYEGPLTVLGGIEQGDDKSDLDLAFAPFPDEVNLSFAQEDGTAQIGYSHGLKKDVDLNARVALQDGNERTEVATRIERLPHELDVAIADGEEGGSVTLDSQADGRLPDVDVRFKGPLDDDIYDARVTVEDLPSHLEASWSLPENGTKTASFEASDQGIGAIEAVITNKAGAPTGLPDLVFTEQQVLALHQNKATGGLRVGGRLERVRSADISANDAGLLDARVDLAAGSLAPALEFDGFLDLRQGGQPLVDANAVVSPLPGQIAFKVQPDEEDQEDLTINYDADASPDIDGSVRLLKPGIANDAACGARGVVCADLRLRHAPSSVEARVFDEEVDGKRQAFIEVDAEGVTDPDLFADVTLGPDLGKGTPLVAHAEILGLTGTTRVRTVEGSEETLERADVHTCDFDYEADECRAGTEDRIRRLDFTVANFLADQRPTDMAPAYAATPNFATVVARGRDGGAEVQFEATGRLHDIKDVTYVNTDAFGVRTDVLGGAPLAAVVDIGGVRVKDQGASSKFYDLTADVLVDPLPQQMSFCVNPSGLDVVEPTSTITEECQQANPFDPDGPALTKSPLSLASDGSSPFDVTVDAEVRELGTAGSDDRDDRRVRGHVVVRDIPESIRAHVISPEDDAVGPTLVTVDAPGATDQVDVDLRAEVLSADLECQDPRIPDVKHEAICASALIENLPTHLDLRYDPGSATDNFVVDSAGPEPVDLRNLVVSSVERDDDPDLDEPRAKILIAEADILDLPRSVRGTLSLPDKKDAPKSIDVTAEPPVGSIAGTVRNFVAPDPIPEAAPQRAGLPEPEDFATFIQREDAFKATLQISQVRHVGYRDQVAADGTKLDTKVIGVDFGEDKDIRAFVDVDEGDGERVLGDVTLQDVPAGIDVCFRGKREPATADLDPVNGTATFCDENPARPGGGEPNPQLEQGALEIRLSPEAPANELDVDAFVRQAKGAGAELVAARMQVDNIPHRVAGTFGSGQADIAVFDADGTPAGIDRIQAHAASFDITDDGWTDATRPYTPRFVVRDPFIYAVPDGQHVIARGDADDFDLRARLGSIDGTPSSALHRVQLAERACAKPQGVDYGGGATDLGPRPDFPHLPTDDETEHTCIRLDVEPQGPVVADPLVLDAVIEKEGKRLALRNGLLSDIPEVLQINLAKAEETQDADPPIRPHCIGEGLNQPTNCIAPLVRVDTSGETELSGFVEVGLPEDLVTLEGVEPRGVLPEPVDPAGWVGERGIRARVATLPGDREAIQAGVRLLLPASFTLDQVGKHEVGGNTQEEFFEAKDLHIRFAGRNADGSAVETLGLVSALVHDGEDGGQILATARQVDTGFAAPGEVALNLFQRDFATQGRNFLQVDGRVSAPLSLRVRLQGVVSEDTLKRLDAQIDNAPALESLAYSANADPTFRLRAEIMGEGKHPGQPDEDPEKEEECSFLLCVLTEVQLQTVRAQFDFQPTPELPARLVEAAIHTDGATNGLEVRGFQDVNGGEGLGDGRVLAGAQLDVDPINVFLHAGIPFVGSADFVMRSDLQAAASIGGEYVGFNPGATDPDEIWDEPIFDDLTPELVGEGTNRFMLEQNLFRMKMENGGGSGSRIGPIDFNIDILHGEAWALFVKLLGIDHLPPFSKMRTPFLDCNLLATPTALGSVGVGANDDRDVVMWPLFPPPFGRIHTSGLLAPVFDAVRSLAGPLFCFLGTDQELMDSDSGQKIHPADPLGPDRTGSTVPDALVHLDPVAEPPGGDDPTDPAPFTVPADVAWCGTQSFGDLVVPAGRTVRVATEFSTLDVRGEPDVGGDAFPGACPDVEGVVPGTLEIVAAGTVDVHGAISGDAVETQSNATGNAGGGYRIDLSPTVANDGRGGSGGFNGNGGFPAPATAQQLDDATFVASGGAGSDFVGGNLRGEGGGIVRVLTEVLHVHGGGQLTANGSDGESAGSTSECAVPDDGTPNQGIGGGGGGAGGGIAISTGSLVNEGTIAAVGGVGGSGSRGGGGGGGGGTVRVVTALRDGDLPIVEGGNGGGSICPDDFPGGGDARDGLAAIEAKARSRIDISDPAADFEFWNSTADGRELVLPYHAAAEADPDDGMTVVLCGTFLRTEDVLTDDDAPDLSTQLLNFSGGFTRPSVYERNDVTGAILPGFPCGKPAGTPTPPITGPTFLAKERINGEDVRDEISAGTNRPEGYHGLWTVVFKSDVAGNDCLNPSDGFREPPNEGGPIPPSGERFDFLHCTAEEGITTPDIVVGVDNTAPTVHSVTLGGVEISDLAGDPTGNVVRTATPQLPITWVDSDSLSQVESRTCFPNAVTGEDAAACTPGDIVTVQAPDGSRPVGLSVVDDAGNERFVEAEVVLDTTAPVSQGEIVAGSAPLGDNGWFRSAPILRLFGFNDFGGTGPGTPPYEYQIDDADVRPCADPASPQAPECRIDGSPGRTQPGFGRHTVRWATIDAVGNRTPDKEPNDQRPALAVKMDDQPPASALLTSPAAPDGANGWFSGQTFVSFGAFDQPGGSGFRPNLLEGEVDTAGIFYKHDGVDQGEFDPLQPVRLNPGTNTICWFSRDIAGQQEAERCQELLVDEADPVADVATSGGTLGLAEWFTASPQVRADVVDFGVFGSGVGTDLAPASTVCAQRPLLAPVAPSGTCISVDGAPFLPINAATARFTLGEGLHEVRAFSTDRAGRRSAIDTANVKVDLSKPVTAVRTIAPDPSRGRWFRAVPTVVLRAADGDRHASGVTAIRYRVVTGTSTTCSPVTTGFLTYRGPFTVPEGVRTVYAWSVDGSGQAGPCVALPVSVDLTRPVPKATTPNPNLWIRVNLLGIIKLQPQTAQLRWTVQENLSGSVNEKVHVDVIVYDVLGNPIRRLDAGDHLVQPGQTLSGQVAWDGRAGGLLGIVPIGTYHYRAVVTDAAGNPAQSGESGALVVVRLL